VGDLKPERSGDVEPRGKLRRFPFIALIMWGLLAFAIPRVVQTLNPIDVGPFPLGFLMAAEGSLIAMLLVAALSAWRQDHNSSADER
jgi:cation/acetate symporter